MAGSSPLTRGALNAVWPRVLTSRLIPAHAGSTHSPPRTRQALRAHPRSRGEHKHLEQALKALQGSSPLTRGAQLNHTTGGVPTGLIPAHAGSTTQAAHPQEAQTAHPRSRGEHIIAVLNFHYFLGSSPLTRGAHSSGSSIRRSNGLIPAHAGSTDCRSRRGRIRTAHPRSRGEHAVEWLNHAVVAGSSPLTRGALGLYGAAPDGEGLIPAHAGSTACAAVVIGLCPAHPRSRGEHTWRSTMPPNYEGSSPLTRGALKESHATSLFVRLIPAHAGSTSTCPARIPVMGAHPRSRGEHSDSGLIGHVSLGSSPLTRGALLLNSELGSRSLILHTTFRDNRT